MKNLKKYLLYYFSKQFIYFLFAGSTAAFVNFTSRLLLRSYMDIVFSAVIAYSLGLLTAFVLYKKLVFPFSEKPLNFQLRRFLSIQIGFMPIVIIIFMDIWEEDVFTEFHPFTLIRAYFDEIYSWSFVRFTVLLSVCMSSIYLFNGISTLIAIHNAGVPPRLYGIYAMFASLGLFVGAYLSMRLNDIIEPMNIIRYGIFLLSITTIVMLACILLLKFSVMFLLIPGFFLFTSAAMVIPNISMLILHQSKKAAIASSVFNAIGLLVASLILSWVSEWLAIGPILLPLSLFFLVVIALLASIGPVRLSVTK